MSSGPDPVQHRPGPARRAEPDTIGKLRLVEGREYELKFDIGPHDVAHVLAIIGRPHTSRRLVSTYFDTEDGILRRENVALRIRRSPDGLVQTLKQTGSSIVDRKEWEHESPLPASDLAWLRGTPLRRLFKQSQGRHLKPCFTVDVHRTLFRLKHDGAEIEGALDRGAISAGGRSVAVRELELELKSGPVRAVLALARRMTEDMPLVLSLTSKSERGYAIGADTWAKPKKEMSVRLRAAMTRAEAFESVVQACLHLFLTNAALLGSQDDSRDRGHVEAVHRARVALRRLRAGLQLFAPVLRRGWHKRLRRDVKWMSDKFGAVRDADVFLTAVVAAVGHDVDRGGQELIDLMVERRKHARSKLRRAMASPLWRAACLDLVQASERGVRRGQRHKRFRTLAVRRFPVLFRSLAKRTRGLKGLSEEGKHSVRKAAKMLRYALDFLIETPKLLPHEKRVARLRTDLQILQKALGTIHDGEAMRRRLRTDLTPLACKRNNGELAIAAAERIATMATVETNVLRKATKAARRVRGSTAFA